MRSLAVCVAALVHAMISAQQTLVVDPAGGGAFTTVQAALAVAAPGDTLFVRGGIYQALHVLSGPLQIVGDPALPKPNLGSVQVLPGSGGGVSLVYLEIPSVTIQGSAALDQVGVGYQLLVQAGSVVMSRCNTSYAFQGVSVTGGDVVFNDCALVGHGPMWQYGMGGTCWVVGPSGPALTVMGGAVGFANSTVTGGTGATSCYGPGVPSPALVVTGGWVRATRSQFVGGAQSWTGGPSTPAVTVSGSGTFEYDASTTFAGVGSTPGTVIFLPATDGRSALGGGTITPTLKTVPGLAALLAASLGRGTSLPTFAGAVWFDPANFVVLALGVTDSLGQLGTSIPVPLGVLRGTAITVQGGAIAPAGVTVAATPVIVHVQ